MKFVHAADLHLDSPMRGLPEPLARATLTAWERVVGLCLREKVDFLLLAGDLYDLRDRSVRARLSLREGLVRLHEAGIRTFVVHGNHDPLYAGAGEVALPPSVKVFGPAWEEVVVQTAGGDGYRVQGISYAEEKVTENLSRHFRRGGREFSVGLLHCNVGRDSDHADYSPCTVEHLSEVGLDYWALGHVHTRREYALASGGVAVYPGNTQGRHGQEPGPRGCVLATVDASGRCERAFVALDPVRFAGARVDVSGVETIDGLVAAVDDATRPQAAEGVEAWVYRIVLEGRGPMHEELSRPGAFDQLVDAVRERLSRRGVHVEFVRNLTGPELDLENAGGLAACVLDVARAREFDALFEDEALKQVEGALRKAGLPSLRDCAEALTDAAAMRAVELLLEGA